MIKFIKCHVKLTFFFQILEFYKFVIDAQKEPCFELDQIGNMDEVLIMLDV